MNASWCHVISQVILANSLRDGAVKGVQLLETPSFMEAFFACDYMLSEDCEQSEGAGDAGIAFWYIVACLCTAADEALLFSASCSVDMPASVGALAIHLALSKPFLDAVSHSGHSPNFQYIRTAAASALEITNAAASSALGTQPFDHRHVWAFGSDNLEKAITCTGRNAQQLLLLARDQLLRLHSSTDSETDSDMLRQTQDK